VLRISGRQAAAALEGLTGSDIPAPRRASLRSFRHPETHEPIDRGLAIFFPGPQSYTGEDMVELHHHGGLAVLQALGEALRAVPGLRPAEPGEFTRRAFLNGKLDLTQAEAIADLVDATTAAQARQALHQLDGALGRRIDGWRVTLLDALARVEAEIDFAGEEGDVGEGLLAARRSDLEEVAHEIDRQLAGSGRAERLRRGLVVAVVGPANAGKSSLVNLLAQREVAIVTPIPGTTRDVVEVQLDLEGWPVSLLDTAGLRESSDPIEREGIARARARAAQADLRVLVLDAADRPEEALRDHPPEAGTLLVLNKVDLPGAQRLVPGRDALSLSCATGEGIAALVAALRDEAARLMDVGGVALVTRERHRAALVEGQAALRRALEAPRDTELALLAEDLRLAARAMGSITGRIGVEDILDRIFASFCIGK
jgi:tRNA modification GTPase